MTPLQAMKQALEALGYGYDAVRCIAAFETINKAQTDLRTAIAEMEKAEPVAWQFERYNYETWDVELLWRNPMEIYTSIEDTARIRNIIPLYTHPQQQTIPEGWQLVPKEPTPEMCAAAWDILARHGEAVKLIYKAMIATTPKL